MFKSPININQLLIISLNRRWKELIPGSLCLPPGVLDSFPCQIKREEKINKHEKLKLSRCVKKRERGAGNR